MNKRTGGLKVGLAAVLVALLIGITACWPNQIGSWHVKDATLRDYMYSVEHRDNGVTAVWMVNDESGVYCFQDKDASFASLKEMLLSDKKVTITYSDVHFFNVNPCTNIESSESSYHVFVATEISY